MIGIINYGLGNIRAFANVYNRLNIPHAIISKPDELRNAEKLILPGVGAFDHAMELLQRSGMRETLDELVLERKVPILGICVGMQMLAQSSEEGKLSGLGWIDAVVKRFDPTTLSHKTHLPHMGWNNVVPSSDNALFRELQDSPTFYFLHSYYVSCSREEHVIARTQYGIQFACAVNFDNVYGVQFHPEKSHHNGVRLLQSFGSV